MALAIHPQTPNGNGMVADRRLCVTADKMRLAEPGDASSAFLLAAGPGDVIAPADVKRLGLALVDGRVVQVQHEPAPAVAEAPAAVVAPVVPVVPVAPPVATTKPIKGKSK